MPFLGVLQFVLLYYSLQWATVAFCDRPSKVYKARSSLSFISAISLFLSLLAVTFPLGYAIFRFNASGVFMPASTQDEAMAIITGPNCTTSAFSCTDCYPTSTAAENAYNASFVTCYKSPSIADSPDGYVPSYPDGIQATVGALCGACSTGCGLFRNQLTAYTVFTDEIKTWSQTTQDMLSFITTAPFMATVVFIFFVYVLLLHQSESGAELRIESLERERDLEREDKLWILDKYAIILDSTHQVAN
jgi:hypothetical protein